MITAKKINVPKYVLDWMTCEKDNCFNVPVWQVDSSFYCDKCLLLIEEKINQKFNKED